MSRLLTQWPGSRETPRLSRVLLDLPVAQGSGDFDDRVLAALRAPLPWWMALWVSLRPVLASAACSLCVMLVLITWSAKAPIGLEPVTLGALHPVQTMAIAPPIALGDLDRLHGRPPTRANLMAALLIPLTAVAAPVPPIPSPRKAPELPRWRRQSCAPSLLA